MADSIQEIRRKRFLFLQKLYEVTGANELESVNLYDLGVELGFEHGEADRIDDYLRAEGLIEATGLGGTIGITHRGIVEVEAAMTKPDEATEYFPPVNFIHVEQMIGSQIQQGTNQSTQTLSYSSNELAAIAKLVEDLKSQLAGLNLETEPEAQAKSDIATIETQIKSPRPKSIIVTECLKSLRAILEGTAGSIIATGLLQQLAIWGK